MLPAATDSSIEVVRVNKKRDAAPKGEVTVKTRGYTGSECLKASKFLEEALGTPTADHKTPEYYETPAVEQQLQL